jgi:hypothetical protein
MMPKVVDVTEVQQALDRAARKAKRGSSEVRAGKVLVGRHRSAEQWATRRRDKPSERTSREKK